jgi:serine/threonine-protein kinase RsbW
MKEKSVTIPSSLEHVPEIDKLAHKMGCTAGLSENDCSDLAIALTEIVKNAILHGNKSDPHKKVSLHFAIGENRLTVSVTDEGLGFNPADVPDPTAPENLLKDTGRGIFVSHHLLDEVHFERISGGMKVTLVKYLDNHQNS